MIESAHVRALFASHTGDWVGPTNSLFTILQYLDTSRISCTVMFPKEGIATEKFRSMGIQVSVSNLDYTFSSIPRLRHIIRQRQASLVYGNNFSGAIRNVYIAAKMERRPFIWHIREILDPKKIQIRSRIFLRLASHVIVPSQACANSVAPYVGSRQKLFVIHNPIDLEKFFVTNALRERARSALRHELHLPSDAFILLNLGRITGIKGQDYLPDIAQSVLARVPNAFFLIVGQTQDEAFEWQLRNVIKGRGLSNRVLFGDFRSDVVSLLRATDLLVHTSRIESFGRVLIEAMAVEVPVIAFEVGAIPEIVRDQEMGFLIKPFDLTAFGEKIVVLAREEEQRRQMGIQARWGVLNRFSAPVIASQIGELLEDVGLQDK